MQNRRSAKVGVVVAGVIALLSHQARAQSDEATGESRDGQEAAPDESSGGEGLDAELAELEQMSLEDLLDIAIEVSSTSTDTLFTTPSTVSVIDRGMIETYNFSSVVEALETVAGVTVVRTYLKRTLPTVRGILQDNYANKVLVLLDGVPAWHASTGEASLDRINIDAVERIEVLRGPASVIYGTNAYSGAINIVLRRPAKTSGEAHLRVGDTRAFEGGASYSYLGEDYRLFVSANGLDEIGHNYIFTDETDVTGRLREYIDAANVTLRFDYKGHSIFFNGFSSHESCLGVVPRFSRGAGRDHFTHGYLGNYTFKHSFSDAADINAGLTLDWQHRNLPRTGDDSVRSNIKGYRVFTFADSRLNFVDWLTVELGADFDYRKNLKYANYEPLNQYTVAENNMENRDMKEFSVFAQGNVKVDPVRVVVGARYTNNERFASNVSARGSAVLSITETDSIKLVAGQSFRAPTFFELFFETPTTTVVGNPDLKPEKSNSVELAYVGRWDDLFVQALGYWASYENKIFRVRRFPNNPTDTSTTYTNGAEFTAWGGELELRYQNPRIVNLFATYYYVHGDNGDEYQDNDHYNFKYVPEHSFAFGLSRSLFPGFAAQAVINWVGPRGGRTDELAAQYTLDLGLSFEHSGGFRHVLAAKDVLDERIMVPEYVRSTLNAYENGFGRRIFYRLEYSF